MELVYMAKDFIVTAAKIVGGIAWRLVCGFAVWIASVCGDLIARIGHKVDR